MPSPVETTVQYKDSFETVNIVKKETKTTETEQVNGKAIKPMSKGKIIANLVVVSIGFLLLFTAYQALANLQSTLNKEEGVGVVSQSIIYVSLILSSMFLPTFIIKKFGCKLTLVVSVLLYAPYIASNFYPKMVTMIPGAIIIGIGASCLWSAKCTYLNEIGFMYAKLVNEDVDVIIVRFFGIFFMFFQSCQIWGNLISWLILRPDREIDVNSTSDALKYCGASFCPQTENLTNPNLERPPDERANTLIGIYLGCCILAAIIMAVFLEKLERNCSAEEGRISARQVLATFYHLADYRQLFLIPLTIYSGIEQTFLLSEFTKAYIACSWGIHRIGFVAICFGIVNATVSLTSGPLVKMLTRIPIFIVAAIANLATLISLLYWKPNPDNYIIFFVVAGVWGLADAVWQTQINAFYGVLFKNNEEAAFSNYRLWESLGFTIGFAYSNFLCVNIKIYIVLCLLIVGMFGYLIIEIKFVGLRKRCKG